jgi:hypothetical protein
MLKFCPKCKKEKDVSEFAKNRCTKDGLQCYCNECKSIKTPEKKERERERDALFILGLKRCSTCKEIKTFDNFFKSSSHKDGFCYVCRPCHNEYLRNRTDKKTEYHRIYAIKYREKNRDRVNEVARRASKSKKTRERLIRLSKDTTHKIIHALRQRLYYAVKLQEGNKQSTFDLLGCSIDFLKDYLESLFRDNMTWDNYGKNGWHIDHIIPCAAFDLTDPEQQKRCFHYTNLQPLWAHENSKKLSYYNGKLYRIRK